MDKSGKSNKFDRTPLTEEEQRMEADDRDSFEFNGPGFGAKIRGAWSSQQVVIVVVIFACTAFLYFERIQTNRGFADQHFVTQAQNVVTQSLLASVLKGQAELSKEVASGTEIQAYVMSLSQEKREQLNLSMPAELRARIRNNLR